MKGTIEFYGPRPSFGFMVIAGALLFILDQALKIWCSVNLPLFAERGFLGQDRLVLSRILNRGIVGNAFSHTGDITLYTRYIPTGVWVLLLAIAALRFPRARLIEKISYVFILAGGASNLWDHWHADYVVDTLQVYLGKGLYLPFNVADAAIVISAVCLLAIFIRGIFRREIFGQVLCNDPVKLFIAKKKSARWF